MMAKKSYEWWLGQALAIYIGVAAIGAWGSITGGLIVTYGLFVLIEIREYAKVGADKTVPDDYEAGYQHGLRDGRDEGHNEQGEPTPDQGGRP